jgi:hypothetical protein
MTNNETQQHPDITRQSDAQAMQFTLGIDFHALVRFGFLEQSARYLGVYYNQDRYQAMDDESNIIN